MHLVYWIAGWLLATVWSWKALEIFFGLPKVDDITEPQWTGEGAALPSLSIIVPARNEAAAIRQCLQSLRSLDYPNLQIVAVNDRSTDKTGEIMEELSVTDPDLKVIHVTGLPPRWLGKTHAMWKGASTAIGDWILFTDGDVIFQHDALRRALNFAETKKADHLVVLPTVLMETPGERMMMSFFLNNLAFIHRLWKVSDPKARDYTGAGAFNLVRRSIYEKIGTYEAMRMEIVDDLALGRAVKSNGFSQSVAIGHGLASLRWAVGAFGVINNLTKNIFALMYFNWAVAIGAAVGTAFLGLGPLLGIIFAPGPAKVGFAISLTAIAVVYLRMSRITRVSPIYFLTQPVACILVVYTLLRSTVVTLWNGGVTWRGTKYDLAELRAK